MWKNHPLWLAKEVSTKNGPTTYKVGPYHFFSWGYDTPISRVISPVTHLFSAIYRGPISPHLFLWIPWGFLPCGFGGFLTTLRGSSGNIQDFSRGEPRNLEPLGGWGIMAVWHCWWFRNPANHLGCIKLIGIFTNFTGAGLFFPSTVCHF